MSHPEQPIGIFDSGIGGLTVTHAISQVLPQESIIYFGDTMHLPYGDKSTESIQNYSMRIADFFLQKNCKLILMACYSASSSAYDVLQKEFGNKVTIVNVIDPIIEYLNTHFADKTVGIIGTRRTIESNIFAQKMKAMHSSQLKMLATPLLAPIIEEGYSDHPITDAVLNEYLTRPELKDIQALVLACTHYPLIRARVEKHLKAGIEIIDASQVTALTLKKILEQQGAINLSGNPKHKFYVSDYTETFAKSAQMFFGGSIDLERYPLWD